MNIKIRKFRKIKKKLTISRYISLAIFLSINIVFVVTLERSHTRIPMHTNDTIFLIFQYYIIVLIIFQIIIQILLYVFTKKELAEIKNTFFVDGTITQKDFIKCLEIHKDDIARFRITPEKNGYTYDLFLKYRKKIKKIDKKIGPISISSNIN